MRLLKRISLATLAIIVVILVLVALALNTEWGARVVMHRFAPMAPGDMQSERVSGTLAGPLVLEGFEYRLGRATLRADSVKLDVAVGDLLTSRLRVEDAEIAGLEVVIAEGEEQPEEPAEPLELPRLGLPVSIDIDRFVLDRAILRLPGGAALELDRLAVRGQLAGGRLEIEELDLGTQRGRVTLSGLVDTGERYRTDLELDVTLPRDRREITGTVTLAGDLDRMEVAVRTQPPVAGALDVTVTDLPWPPSVDGTLALERVDPGALGLEGYPGPLAGRLTLAGDPGSLDVVGWLAAGPERVELRRLALRRDGSRLALEALELEGRDGARVSANGTMALGGETPEIRLDARWQAVAVPLGEGRALESDSGRVDLAGRPSDYTAQGEIRVGGVVPPGTWRFAGHGDTGQFRLESLEAEALDGNLSASGRVTWRPGVTWSLEAGGRGLDPAMLAPAWSGRLGFEATSEGRLTERGPVGELHLVRLDGELRGRRIDGAAEIGFDGLDHLEGNLTLRSGDSHLDAEGRVSETVDLTLGLDLRQLGDWHPDAAGSLRGDWRVTGPRAAPRVAGSVQGEALAFRDHVVETLKLSADAGLAVDSQPGRVRMRLAGAELAGVPVDRLELIVAGTRARHDVELSALHGGGEPEGAGGTASDEEGLEKEPEESGEATVGEAVAGGQRLALQLNGGLEDARWSGRITDLSLGGPRVGAWRLARPVDVALAPGRAALSRLCLSSDTGELCARGEWTPEAGLEGDARLAGVPLAMVELPLQAALKRPVSLSGTLDLEAVGRLPPDGPAQLQVRLETRDAEVALGVVDGMARLALSPVNGRLTLEGNRLRADARLGLDEAGTVGLELESAEFSPATWARAPVSGRLIVDLDDLAPLGALAGPVASPAGALNGELTLDGALGAMGLGGSLTLSDFSGQLPAAGITLEQGRLDLEARSGELAFEGGAVSDGGELAIKGRIGLGSGGDIAGEATVGGENFLAVDRPGLSARISPDLDLSLAERRLVIRGTVTVPEAAVDAGELRGGGVSASPDVIVAGDEPVSEEPAISLNAEIDVILGEDISLKAPGFEGSAEGRLHVSDRSGRPPLGQGQLTVSGTYEAYGQELSIRRGQLLFSDTPLDNPALDITAVRETRDVTAGVRIAGTARQPRLTLFSEPPLGSESEILSYLILGRPLDSVSSSEGATLTGAATSLGLRGGGLLAQRIGARLGLEEIEVGQSEALGQSALTLGKYLSPRLYIGYGVGLVEPVSVVRLRYELTEHWALEAASGKETTAAIKFNYER